MWCKKKKKFLDQKHKIEFLDKKIKIKQNSAKAEKGEELKE
jgi:hypothetical protein